MYPSPPPLEGRASGGLRLLILQPTPFCNINCDYCYLKDRDQRGRMTQEVLRMAIRRIVEADLVGEALSVVWHAGEPLTLPPSFYREAFRTIRKECPRHVAVRHSIQTNGMLLDDSWCEFLSCHEVRVGVSLDGPAWLHDLHRRSRDGRGTHAKVMQGIGKLLQHRMAFHVIAVLTHDTLAHADEIYEFFCNTGVREVGFNIEEIEAGHGHSSLMFSGVEQPMRAFWERLLMRWAEQPELLRIREVEEVLAVLRDRGFGRRAGNSQNVPLAMLSIAHDGDFSSFSPELLGFTDPRHGSMSFGNVLHDRIDQALERSGYRAIAREVAAGVSACRASCEYFPFCRGGAPANKLAEAGRFDGTETLFCRLTQKIVVEAVLNTLADDLGITTACGRVSG